MRTATGVLEASFGETGVSGGENDFTDRDARTLKSHTVVHNLPGEADTTRSTGPQRGAENPPKSGELRGCDEKEKEKEKTKTDDKTHWKYPN